MIGFIRRLSGKLSKLSPDQVKKILDGLIDENETLDAVLESLDTGLIVSSTDWQLAFVNKAALRYIPLKVHFFSEKIWNLIEDADISLFLKKQSLCQKKCISGDFTLHYGSEHFRFVQISVLPLVRLKKISGYIIQIDDVSEKRRQEMLIRRMENLASLTNVAASVAHEIKNPLGAISIHIQLMQKALKKARSQNTLPEKEYAEKYLDTINEEIDRLNQIIVDFLFAVRPITANLLLVNPNEILYPFFSFIKAELEEKNITLKTSLAENPPLLKLDTKLFKQILMNLTQNAIAAMKNGGILTFHSEITTEYFIFTIEDTGEGMDTQTVSRIFEPYFTTKAQGTGLGLTMVYKIIKEFAADISVKSVQKQGTVFTITLPIPQSTQQLLSS